MKIKLVSFFAGISFICNAQEQLNTTSDTLVAGQEKLKTIFDKGKTKHYISGWGGFTPAYQILNEKNGFSTFIRGGILIDRKLTIGFGGAYSFLASEENKEVSLTDTFNTSSNYFGLVLGYDIKPLEPVHVSFSALIGGGSAVYYSLKWASNKDEAVNNKDVTGVSYSTSTTFVLRPSISLDFNITEWFRLGAETGYVFAPNKAVSVPKIDSAGTAIPEESTIVIKENGMSGFFAGVALKLGVF